jgi:glycerate kinase
MPPPTDTRAGQNARVRIVVAPTAFKGSLSARQAALHIARGVRSALPRATVEEVPVADGGDGTVEAAVAAGYERREVAVTGPIGDEVLAPYALRGRTAIVEMAAASGIAALTAETLAPLTASSIGTGELIRAALNDGAKRIVLGVGGSASTDGGAGLAVALGARLVDDASTDLDLGGGPLVRAARLDLSALDARIAATTVVLASDVDSPLLGPAGAAATFAPQKGASAEQITVLEAGLTRWVTIVEATVGTGDPPYRERAGSGAGGGVGFAAMALLGAERRPGIDVVLEMINFEARLRGADLVITGEGALDRQTLRGKAPAGVAVSARRVGVPTVVLAGSVSLSPDDVAAADFVAAHELAALERDPLVRLQRAGVLLERLAAIAAENWSGSG